jgi:hypothetical protein
MTLQPFYQIMVSTKHTSMKWTWDIQLAKQPTTAYISNKFECRSPTKTKHTNSNAFTSYNKQWPIKQRPRHNPLNPSKVQVKGLLHWSPYYTRLGWKCKRRGEMLVVYNAFTVRVPMTQVSFLHGSAEQPQGEGEQSNPDQRSATIHSIPNPKVFSKLIYLSACRRLCLLWPWLPLPPRGLLFFLVLHKSNGR